MYWNVLIVDGVTVRWGCFEIFIYFLDPLKFIQENMEGFLAFLCA